MFIHSFYIGQNSNLMIISVVIRNKGELNPYQKICSQKVEPSTTYSKLVFFFGQKSIPESVPLKKLCTRRTYAGGESLATGTVVIWLLLIL